MDFVGQLRKFPCLSDDPDMFAPAEDAFFMAARELSSISCTAKVTYQGGGCANIRDHAVVSCLETCVSSLTATLPTYALWLMASTNSWEKDTPRRHYDKLWRGLRRRGSSLALNECREEAIYSHAGMKFFGAAKLRNDEIAAAFDVVKSSNTGAAFIIMLPGAYQADVYEYVRQGWGFFTAAAQRRFWTALISRTCLHDGIFFRTFGEFDDTLVGLNAIMRRDIFAGIFQES